MKKKIFGITLAVCLVVLSIASSTMAYFTDTTSKTQVFTSGNVDIEFESPAVFTAADSQTPQNVRPGEQIGKAGTVVNVGSEDAFVGIIISVDKYKTGEDIVKMFSGIVNDNVVVEVVSTTNVDGNTSNCDIYVYCKAELNGLATASGTADKFTFFNAITIPALWGNSEMAAFKGATITVTAYATQTFGFVDDNSATNDAVIALKAAFPDTWSAVGN